MPYKVTGVICNHDGTTEVYSRMFDSHSEAIRDSAFLKALDYESVRIENLDDIEDIEPIDWAGYVQIFCFVILFLILMYLFTLS